MIRDATAADLDSINAIYNHYVLTSTATYQTEPDSPADRAAWFAAHGPAHPVTVAIDAGRVVGWGALSRFHVRAAFAPTVEDSVYVHHECHGRGIGTALLVDLIARAQAIGHHRIIAAVCADQQPSLHLHQRHGFRECGRLGEVGWKFARWLDLIYLQRPL